MCGSPYIETEHLPLGLLKEDPSLPSWSLSAAPGKAIHLAVEEANGLASRTVRTAHLLVGLLRIRDGLRAPIPSASPTELARLRQRIHAGHLPSPGDTD